MKDFKASLLSLLPKGKAWEAPKGSLLYALMVGASNEFKRIHDRGNQLLKESDPRTCVETLEDWERVFGLPDKCDQGREDFSLERRFKLVNRALSFRGGQSPQYFIDYIRALGFESTVEEYREFRAGLSCAEDSLSNGIEWTNTWALKLPATLAYEFSADVSTAGEPLRVFSNDSVECSINHIKPAHTHTLFLFENVS